MRIKIKERIVCDNCHAKRCKFLNVANTKRDFFNLPSETTVCPTSAIDDNGPTDTDLNNGIISSNGCVECGLCAKFCTWNNLEIEGGIEETKLFGNLTELQLKAVTSMYLSQLFHFAANTNRNNSLPFDGYVSTLSGQQAFVEIDYGDDSLESVRRLLGDVLTYSDHNIRNGIVILSHLPQKGSVDVYNVLDKLKVFPTTTDLHIYFTTFSVLKSLCIAGVSSDNDFEYLLFDPFKEGIEDYVLRINTFKEKGKKII